MWSDLLHRDATAVGEREHDFGDAVVAQASPGISVPLVLRLRDHSPDGSQEGAVQVLQHGLLLGVTVHVHAVGRVGFTEGRTRWSLIGWETWRLVLAEANLWSLLYYLVNF